jgi:arsenate reductase-like glutaredoxin family protein
MEYFLFTYPNCEKCEAIKKVLAETELEGAEYNLSQKENKLKIREFRQILKRDEKGGIILPTLVLQEAGEVLAILNTQEELGDWLKSKA